MKRILSLLFLGIALFGWSQNKKFDQLEHLYDQGHFSKVNRKAKYLLNKPEYDFSVVPSYYTAISGFQLMINDKWKSRSQKEFDYSLEQFNRFLKNDQNQKIYTAHYEEISFLKKDLEAWLEQNKGNNTKNIENNVVLLLTEYFQEIKADSVIATTTVTIDTATVATKPDIETTTNSNKNIVSYAKNFVGTKYKWAGNTPSGFDCSGYTSYVYKEFNQTLSRRAIEQYNNSKKIKRKQVKPGDLIFFGSKSNINHVGIVVSNTKDELIMIHASTSKGVIITNVFESTYWKNKVAGYGSYF